MKYGEAHNPMFIDEQALSSIYDLHWLHRDRRPDVQPCISQFYSWSNVTRRWTDWTYDPGFKSVFPPHVPVEARVEVVIPFSGFYETIHDGILDDIIDGMCRDNDGDTDSGLVSAIHSDVDWHRVKVAYADLYCQALFEFLGVEGVFSELVSPREYNFTNDRIFANVRLKDVKRMLGHPGVLTRTREVAAEMFTSRSGFISFYNPSVESWGLMEKWDLNELGTVVKAYADVLSNHPEFDNDDESSLMEDYKCNGRLDELVWKHLDNADRHSESISALRGEPA